MIDTALAEAKEYSNHVLRMIDRARDKAWQILLFVLGIDVYIIKQLSESDEVIMYYTFLGLSAIYSAVITWKLAPVLFPATLTSPGAQASALTNVMTGIVDDSRKKPVDVEWEMKNAILEKVSIQVDNNRPIAAKMTKSVKQSMYLLIFQALSLAVVIVLFSLPKLFV